MSKKRVETGVLLTTKSAYGSHSDMVIEDLGDKVKCKDDIGTYITDKSRLDTGLADPNRWNR